MINHFQKHSILIKQKSAIIKYPPFRKSSTISSYLFSRRFISDSFPSSFEKPIIIPVSPEETDENLVLAAPVQFPFISGMKSRVMLYNQFSDFKNRNVAFFLSKNKSFGPVNSLKDIYRVGTLCKATISGSNRDIKISSIDLTAIKTVRAVEVKNGFVRLEDYGDREICTMKFNMMPSNLKEMFITTKDILFKLNKGKSGVIVNGLIETVENLRVVMSLFFSEKPKDIQNILEKKSLKECLEELFKFVKTQKLLSDSCEKQTEILKKLFKNEQQEFIRSEIDNLEQKLGNTFGSREREKMLSRLKNKFPPEEIIQSIKNYKEENDSYLSELNYLDTVSKIPWGVFSTDNFDLKKAREILNKEHFGMKDVKKRIIEFIASGKLRKSIIQGKIICLLGPPGVGKTSIGKSIAASLGKKFCRMSLGGVDRISEIKGHRKTYSGSMAGQIVNELIKAQTLNPLFMIDEIDKFGSSYRGSLAHALLDLFDPAQNKEFVDHFVRHPLDVSKVLFICTANSTDPIPTTLLDRMEIIQISGYTDREKVEICQKYIFPKLAKQIGIDIEKVHFKEGAVEALIHNYCRESGLRSLEKAIHKIFRKIAVKIIDSKIENFEITAESLEDFLGEKVFQKGHIFKVPPVGVVNGLAYTNYGGSILPIETTTTGDKKSPKSQNPPLKTTGSLGKVLNESIPVAHIIAQKFFAEFLSQKFPPNASSNNKKEPPSIFNAAGEEIDRDFFRHKIHVHLPEGAVPKDGPSAGVALAMSLFSLASRTAVRPSLCFTGEISLSGKVLAIGGLKEKLLAAKRSGINEVMLPKANEEHLEEIDEELKKGFIFHLVEDLSQAFRITFPSLFK